MPSKTHHIIILALCIVIIAGCFLFRADDTGLFLFGFKWPFRCFLKETVGLKCALCGISRSLCSAAHGNLKASLGYHPVGPFIFGFILWQLPYRIWALKAKRNLSGNSQDSAGAGLRRFNIIAAIIIVSAIFINWIVYLVRTAI
jgi:hypothetical protein